MARVASSARSRATASFLLLSCFLNRVTALGGKCQSSFHEESVQRFELVVIAYFVGAISSSISPLMKEARSLDEALISSCDLETVNLDSSSSRTLTDFEFSDLIWLGECCSTTSIAGAMAGGVGAWEYVSRVGGVENQGVRIRRAMEKGMTT